MGNVRQQSSGAVLQTDTVRTKTARGSGHQLGAVVQSNLPGDANRLKEVTVMSVKTLLFHWLHGLSDAASPDLEVEAELQFHLEMRAQENMRAGMSSAAAWEDAR